MIPLQLQCVTLNKDYNAASQYLRKAAELDSVDANYPLSLIYLEGKVVEQDVSISFSLMVKAAIAGHPTARYRLGYYEMKTGTFERVVKHWVIAAK